MRGETWHIHPYNIGTSYFKAGKLPFLLRCDDVEIVLLRTWNSERHAWHRHLLTITMRICERKRERESEKRRKSLMWEYVWRPKCAISENKMPLNQVCTIERASERGWAENMLFGMCTNIYLCCRRQRQISSTPTDWEEQLNWTLLLLR